MATAATTAASVSPSFKGAANWAEWDDAIKNAALAENVSDLLDLTGPAPLSEPENPGPDAETETWNEYVHSHYIFQRANNNLLAGIRRTLSPFMKDKVKDIYNARQAYDILKSERRQHPHTRQHHDQSPQRGSQNSL